MVLAVLKQLVRCDEPKLTVQSPRQMSVLARQCEGLPPTLHTRERGAHARCRTRMMSSDASCVLNEDRTRGGTALRCASSEDGGWNNPVTRDHMTGAERSSQEGGARSKKYVQARGRFEIRARRSDRMRRKDEMAKREERVPETSPEKRPGVRCCGRRRPRQTLTSMSRRFPTTRSLCSRHSRAVKLYCSLGRIGVGVCNRTASELAQVRVLTRYFRFGPADQDSLCLQFIQRSVRREAVSARCRRFRSLLLPQPRARSRACTACSSASTSLSATAEFVNDTGEATKMGSVHLISRESQALNGEQASVGSHVNGRPLACSLR